MLRWILRAGVLSALAFVLSCVASAPSAPPAPTSAPAVALDRRENAAAARAHIAVDFGHISVPAVRRDASAGALQLAFAWLHSRNSEGRAPVVYLEGGPGSPSLWMADNDYGYQYFAPILAVADVIIFDQRGVGQSQPDTTWSTDAPLETDFFATREAAWRVTEENNRRAIDAMRARGVRLDAFTTEESADDVDDLRAALGLEKISIFGFSYGTHLGLSVLRRHGEHIDRAILAGIEGPDDTWKPPLGMDEAWERIARLAAADPNVAAAGDLNALLARVAGKLDREPMRVTIDMNGRSVIVPVGSFGLYQLLRADIGDATDIPVFPRLLYDIDRGDTRLLGWFVRKRFGWTRGVQAMSMMMDSASGATAQRLALIAEQSPRSRFGNAANFPYPEIAALYQPPALATDFRAPVHSTVPTLFLAGDLDWNTPPRQAEAAMRGFSNAQLILVHNAGHEQIYPNREVQAAVTRFLRGEAIGPISPAYPELRFVPLDDHVQGPSHPALQALRNH